MNDVCSGDMPSPFQDLLPHSDGDSDRDSGPFGNSPPAGDPMQMPAPTTTPPAPAYPPPAPATDGMLLIIRILVRYQSFFVQAFHTAQQC